MRKKIAKTSGIVASLLLAFVFLFFGARSFIFSRIKESIITRFKSLQSEGIVISYNSLETDSWKKNLIITGLEVKFNAHDSICHADFSIHRLEANGIALLPLMFKHELRLDDVFLDEPQVRALNNFKMRPGKRKKFFTSLRIGVLKINSGVIDIQDSASCNSIAQIQLSLDSRDLTANEADKNHPFWTAGEVKVTNVSANFPADFYKMTAKEILYNGGEAIFEADSIKIIPLYDRAEFAKRAGQQVDQFTCTIPAIRATGFEIGKSALSLTAHHIDISFNLDAFRDKRIPRIMRKPTVLPVTFLRHLKFPLQIDTLVVSNSYASYQEILASGSAPGKVFFGKVNAVIANISNRSTLGTAMSVRSRFMDAGDLKIDFTFPSEVQKPYTVRGALSNFSMPRMNAMLMPAAHTEIESGEMQEMRFYFQYNEYQSDGEVELAYTNLKLLRFKKNEDKKVTRVNKLISFLLNVFVRDDMDENDSKEKKTGTIHVERDSQKGIFNYWLKSVLSGIKSQLGLKGSHHQKKVKSGDN